VFIRRQREKEKKESEKKIEWRNNKKIIKKKVNF
jgi:hypothetical protein